MSAEARVRFVTGAILVAGFATAIVIYFVNAAPDDASGYRLEDSKKYVREMEIYGGKMNLLASELGNWFSGLWHGRSLAFTVGCHYSAGSAGLPAPRDARAIGR